MIPRYKVVLCGDGGVGKTAYMKRLKSGEFVKEYEPTIGVEVYPLKFFTNHGPLIFNIWDCSGVEANGGIRDGYVLRADGAIVMFDITNRETFNHLSSWHLYLVRCGEFPICFAGNKCEVSVESLSDEKEKKNYVHLATRKSFFQQMVKLSQPKKEDGKVGEKCRRQFSYYDISVKSKFGIVKPLLYVARKITGIEDLAFIKEPSTNYDVYSDTDVGEFKGIVAKFPSVSQEEEEEEEIDLTRKCDSLLKDFASKGESYFNDVDKSASVYLSEVIRVSVEKLVELVVDTSTTGTDIDEEVVERVIKKDLELGYKV